MWAFGTLIQGSLLYGVVLGVMYFIKDYDNLIINGLFWILMLISTLIIYNTFMRFREDIIAVGVNFKTRNIDINEWLEKHDPKSNNKENQDNNNL